MSFFNKIFLSVLFGFYSLFSIAADTVTPALQGRWTGVWYIGMSSGKAVMSIDEKGRCRINFTNLDEFGEDAIEVNKFNLDADKVSFSVPSKYSASFQIQLKLKQDGKTLDGSGKFDGAAAKLVFTKSD